MSDVNARRHNSVVLVEPARITVWSMIKSELIKRISAQNPHLYERDIDKIVSVMLDEMVEALRRGD